jgi:hypothetical protein
MARPRRSAGWPERSVSTLCPARSGIAVSPDVRRLGVTMQGMVPAFSQAEGIGLALLAFGAPVGGRK